MKRGGMIESLGALGVFLLGQLWPLALLLVVTGFALLWLGLQKLNIDPALFGAALLLLVLVGLLP